MENLKLSTKEVNMLKIALKKANDQRFENTFGEESIVSLLRKLNL